MTALHLSIDKEPTPKEIGKVARRVKVETIMVPVHSVRIFIFSNGRLVTQTDFVDIYTVRRVPQSGAELRRLKICFRD